MNEGVRLDNNKFIFDFKTDMKGDIINLQFANTRSRSKKNGLDIYSGWVLNKDADSEQVSLFRKELKHDSSMIDPKDKQMLINKAVIGFDKQMGVSTYDIIIYPKSSSNLASELGKALHAKSSNTILAHDAIIKNKLEEIKIDFDGYIKNAKTPEEAAARKKKLQQDFKAATKTGTFQIKKVHQFRKKIFSNFLVFPDDTSRRIYNAISEGRVLLVDDILTTGATLGEMIRLVNEYNPSNITFCVLIR